MAMSSTVHQLLIQHFDAHQRSGEDTIESRLAKVAIDLNELSLTQDLNNLTVSSSKGKKNARGTTKSSNDGTSDDIGMALLVILDCFIVSESSIDDSMLGLLVGIARSQIVEADALFHAWLELRIQPASLAALDRLRVLACRLIGATRIGSHLLIPRLTDKAQSVRFAAIQACGAFYGDDSNAGTNLPEMEQALLWCLDHDPSFNNRMTALQSLALSTETVDHVILRLRDTKPKVRLQAIEVLHQMSFTNMTADQCAAIVRAGLTDRCKETTDATSVLVCTRWMKTAKYDPLVLIAHLAPCIYETECEQVIQMLLKVSASDGTNESYLRDLSDSEVRAFFQGMTNLPTSISPQHLLMARLMVQHQSNERTKMDMLNKIVPDVPVLCDFIQDSLDSDTENEAKIFCCNQLLKLAQMMDLQEEGSRRHFSAACKTLLQNTDAHEDLLEECIKALMHDPDYLRVVADICEGIKDSQLRVVSILTIVLENTSPYKTTGEILKNLVAHVVPAVTSDDEMIREAGVGCLGRLALLSDEATVLAEFKPLFLEVLSNEKEKVEIRAQAMLALSDLAMLFRDVLLPSEDNGTSLVPVVASMLRNKNPSVVAVAAEVATKLLFSDKVNDSDLVAALLVVFFNKAFDDYDEDEQNVQEVGSVYRMQQLLSLFFPAYSMKNKETKSTLVKAIRPMLEMITKKRSRGTPIWPISKMIEFVYSTAEVGTDEADDKEEDSTNAINVCLEISTFLVHSNETLSVSHLRTLCKLLGGADVDVESTNCRNLLAKLKEVLNELTMLICDEASLESLETMVELLDDVTAVEVENDDDTGTDNEEEELADALTKIALMEEKENPAVSRKAGEQTRRRKQALVAVN